MASGEEKTGDFYAVLGLKKECSSSELRNAYKKLALKWHPDRFSASGDLKFVEDAKKKFQTIHEAYSVLSDENKRLMYDVGVYDSDDDENGMSDFLGEMAAMMNQAKTNENKQESFEDLQELFEEMFQRDANFGSTSQAANGYYTSKISSSSSSNNSNKRNSINMNSSDFSSFYSEGFCLGAKNTKETRNSGSGRRNGRKQKVSSSSRNGTSRDTQISA